MLKYTMCCSPYTHGEWYLLESTQLGAELLPLPLVAPPLVAGRENTWITASHGSSTSADAGEANSIVLLLPGCGHFYVENMHPLPWQGAIECLWSNLAFKKAVIACAWLVAGQAGSPPVLPGPRQCIQWKFYRSCWPSNVMRALASPCPHISWASVLEEPSPTRLQSPRPMRPSGLAFAWAPLGCLLCCQPPRAKRHEFSLWRTKGCRDLSTSPSDVLLGTGQSSRASCHRSPYRRLALYCSRATDARSTLGPPASPSARWLSARTRSMWCGLHC